MSSCDGKCQQRESARGKPVEDRPAALEYECVHGLDLRIYPRCYLCKPMPEIYWWTWPSWQTQPTTPTYPTTWGTFSASG